MRLRAPRSSAEPPSIRRPVRWGAVIGSALASFAVEDFSVDRLLRLNKDEIAARFHEFKKLTHFDAV